VSEALAAAYRAAGTIYARGNITVAANVLAMNFVLDRAAEGPERD